jgi:hypothetical protein
MIVNLDLNNLDDYQTFLRIKRLPLYRFKGRSAIIPDEYAERIGLTTSGKARPEKRYKPPDFLFDYQEGISNTAYSVTADLVRP